MCRLLFSRSYKSCHYLYRHGLKLKGDSGSCAQCSNDESDRLHFPGGRSPDIGGPIPRDGPAKEDGASFISFRLTRIVWPSEYILAVYPNSLHPSVHHPSPNFPLYSGNRLLNLPRPRAPTRTPPNRLPLQAHLP